ncbi:hypothetical protein O6H91_18G028100 [Diphasiastrum complanatum]|uniref:Uncharacterized protein n=1 Tax=Diphasiastrum complanatum TaxID=34168 RepID=A0ACC2B086_DIPCM|nr:hypothetical protein O6H91_18G028100 [Diphasiastrum complanatum]
MFRILQICKKSSVMQSACSFDSRIGNLTRSFFAHSVNLFSFNEEPEIHAKKEKMDSGSKRQEWDLEEILGILDQNLPQARLEQELKEWQHGKLRTRRVGEVLSHVKKADAALSFFEWARQQRGFRHTAYTYNRLFSLLVKLKMYEKAQSAFLEMLATGCCPNNYTFGILISAFCLAGQADEALRFYEDIKRQRLDLNFETCSVLIHGLCKSDKADHAHKVFEKMNEAFTPNLSTYTLLLHGLCKLKKLDEAYRLFVALSRKGVIPEELLCRYLLCALCKAGKLDEACKVVEAVNARNGPFTSLPAYSILINSLCRGKRPLDAYHYLTQMVRSGFSPKLASYNNLINALCKDNKVDCAYKVLQDMLENGSTPNIVTYTIMVNGLSKADKVNEACKLFDMMMEGGCVPDAIMYNTFIFELCHVKRFEKAHDLFNDMVQRGHCPDIVTYSRFLKCLCQAGKKDEAHEIFELMLGKGCFPDADAYQAVFEVVDDAEKASVMLRIMKKSFLSKSYKTIRMFPLQANNGKLNTSYGLPSG